MSRIVSMMGGGVCVESEVGKGSSFSAQLLLPVAPPGIRRTHTTAALCCVLMLVLLCSCSGLAWSSRHLLGA